MVKEFSFTIDSTFNLKQEVEELVKIIFENTAYYKVVVW
jgi:hypothetical protein